MFKEIIHAFTKIMDGTKITIPLPRYTMEEMTMGFSGQKKLHCPPWKRNKILSTQKNKTLTTC
jgi:hypothetical protein